MIFLREKSCRRPQTQGGPTASIPGSSCTGLQWRRTASCCASLRSKAVSTVGTRVY
uniref:Glycogenin 1 n=1 Tax=Molossus molossus TaxID=27622 RepID=A0A7J8I038_MOLMO|nr:glycogenin 1 [Molossus molossus]